MKEKTLQHDVIEKRISEVIIICKSQVYDSNKDKLADLGIKDENNCYWSETVIDLREVFAMSKGIEDGEEVDDVTIVSFKSGANWTIDLNYYQATELWFNYLGRIL